MTGRLHQYAARFEETDRELMDPCPSQPCLRTSIDSYCIYMAILASRKILADSQMIPTQPKTVSIPP